MFILYNRLETLGSEYNTKSILKQLSTLAKNTYLRLVDLFYSFIKVLNNQYYFKGPTQLKSI